jgi:hypothetical protein
MENRIFAEEEELQAVFLISASSQDVFNSRIRTLQEVTGFSGDSFEKDFEFDVWKVITTAYFNDFEELKLSIKKMQEYEWLLLSDSHILIDDEYLFSAGEWLV